MKRTRLLFLTLLLFVSIGVWAQGTFNYTANGREWRCGLNADGTAAVVGVTTYSSETSGVLNIPDAVIHPVTGAHHTVTRVGALSGSPTDYRTGFWGYGLITEVNIPTTVKVIAKDCFRGCSGLTTVGMPSVEVVEDGAFGSCSGLHSINAVNLREIGEGAFGYCSALTSLNYFPALTKIGNDAFARSGLTGAITIPSAVTTLGDGVFGSCVNLTSVAGFPATMTVLPAKTFAGCRNLTSVNLPVGVTRIGKMAFHGCTNLANLPSMPAVTFIEESAFAYSGLTGAIVLPGTLATLERGVFERCANLTSVTGYPATLTEIPDMLFQSCRNLTSVDLPAGITSVGHTAFQDCGKLTSWPSFSAALRSVGSGAFSGCVNLEGTLPPLAGVTLGEEAFLNCKKLTAPAGGLSFENVTLPSGVFQNCHSLTGTLTLNNVTFSGRSQFTGTSFQRLVIGGDILTNISGSNFERFGAAYDPDSSLPLTINWPSGITSVPDGFLTDMYFLTGDLNLPASVTSIGGRAFSRTKLKGDISSLFTSGATVNLGAFQDCPNITGDVVVPDNYLPAHGWSIRNAIPGLRSSISSLDLGNITLFYSEYHANSVIARAFQPLWGGTSPSSLYWVDARDCGVGYNSGTQSAWKFSRKFDPTYDTPQFLSFSVLAMNALIYLPTESTFQAAGLPHNTATFAERFASEGGENFIMDGKCERFLVVDSLSYRVPYAFIAHEAKYDRVFNVTDGKACSTLYLPYPTDLPAGMQAYQLVKKGSDVNGDNAFIFRAVPLGTRLSANTPYIVRITDGQSHTLPVMHNVEVPVSPKMTGADGGQLGIEDSNWKFYGTTEKLANAEAYAKKAYYLNSNKWWQIQNGVENDYIAPFRCFVSSPTNVGAANSFILVLDDEENGTTGINELESSTENDIRSGKYPFYSVDGKPMGKDYGQLERGQIYIVNGKKFYKN